MIYVDNMIISDIRCEDKITKIFWDMDGTCASMEMQLKEHKLERGFFYRKRPIKSIITYMKKYHDMGAQTYILSYCGFSYQRDDKIKWLKENTDFIKEENIIIIPRKEKDVKYSESKNTLKAEYLKDYITADDIVYLIDDNEAVLLGTKERLPYINIISPIDFIE